MRTSFLPQPLVWLLLATSVSAQRIVEELSFGHAGSSLSSNGRTISNWRTSSINHNLQILSDRVILTPPAPGNARGALWSEKTITAETWSAEVEFRASGQETGQGNLNFWFAKDKNAVNIDSVYTVANFDGLAIVIDQYGGGGGKIRGFLNDGSQNFRTHGRLESLAFGHCDYSYRNLGRPSKLRVSSQDGLKVTIDDKECFSSSKISLPSGYYFGVTAATADQPDTFEIVKFVVTDSIPHQHPNVVKGETPPPQQPPPPQPGLSKLDRFPGAPEAVPDKLAEEIKSQEEQFADLHNRLQGLTHQVANIFGEFGRLSQQLEQRHNEMMRKMPDWPHDKFDALNRRMEALERNVDQIKRDVEGKDYREHLDKLNRAIESVRGGLTDNLPDAIGRMVNASAPRMGMFVFIVLAMQVMLAGAYIVYKRRRATMPKKYL